MKVCLVFHISILELAAKDLLPGHISPPPSLAEIDGKEEYMVQEVLYS